MKKVMEAVEDGIQLVLGSEALVAADGAITLQAIRSGTIGYTGELIQVPLRKFARLVALQVFEYVAHDLNLEPVPGVTAEERRQGVVKLYMEHFDELNLKSATAKDPKRSKSKGQIDFDK